MPQIHNLEKEQFEKLFKQERIARFEKRFAILDAFLKTEQHLTVADLKNMLGAEHPDFTLEFIEETMELMALFGFAHKNRFEDGEVRYEHLHLWQHHDHMICTKCGQILEFEDPALERRQLEVARARGFHMLQHKMELYGICAQCLKDRLGIPLPLSGPAGPGSG